MSQNPEGGAKKQGGLLKIAGVIIVILLGVIAFFARNLVSDFNEMKKQQPTTSKQVETISTDVKHIISKLPNIEQRISDNASAIKVMAIALKDPDLQKQLEAIMNTALSSIIKQLNKMEIIIKTTTTNTEKTLAQQSQLISKSTLNLENDLSQFKVSFSNAEENFDRIYQKVQSVSDDINEFSKFSYAGNMLPFLGYNIPPKIKIKDSLTWQNITADYSKKLDTIGLAMEKTGSMGKEGVIGFWLAGKGWEEKWGVPPVEQIDRLIKLLQEYKKLKKWD